MIDDLADAAEIAAVEMRPLTGSAGVHVRVKIDLVDAKRELISLDELREAGETLELRKVQEVEISVGAASPTPTANTVHIAASRRFGLAVYAEHFSASFTHGIVSLMKDRLENGHKAAWDAWESQPPSGAQRFEIAFLSLLVVGAIATMIIRGNDLGALGISAMMVTFVTGLATVVMSIIKPIHGRPPSLTLIAPGIIEPVASTPGPIIRARDWLYRHPVVALTGTFALGVLANVVANSLPS